ncbi:ABC transporter ATP-binding protein [Clostridium beijerinckii]|uniref:Energy-coupling factor transport system ATP-binding protein n=1 Tax=Clostridium beijerinckii TaxID=1520 RepID=A0AAE5H1I5_CLOBE|nr:energy-coupling factor ABC transporter ATP-binding protein [Clostridium beijerinckii]NSB12315.1 energy-coupling factor transport system ATP-binding protein [Clostridium beijerinckii]OOM30801.1 putative HMP/thiamine import ATP-binding protein YkoD [Clostridium beijerinckii]
MVEIENAAFKYQEKSDNGVYNINLKIKKGECILLCGKSGCGKTTVSRMINGLVPHFYSGEQSGTIKIEDVKVSDIPMYKISEKVGSVFQNPRSQFFNVDTDSEIVFGMENLSYPIDKLKERMNKTIKDLHIEKFLGRSIFELSGGEKQKVAFASIYAMSPEIYVLDEPSSNLDADAIEELKAIITMLKKQGKTIVIAEHRLYYLKDIADRIVYMENGFIRNIYTKNEFLDISENQRKSMGLRTMNLSDINIVKSDDVQRNYVLELKNLSLTYNKKTIISNINLKAAPGEIIGIIGHNGAGKSTFLKTLCGLYKDCNGSIKWNGKEINSKQRLNLSYMVMQDVNYQLFAESVEKECYLGIKEANKDIVESTLKELKIYKYKDRHPNTLSGGQKQRTAVAVSMICNKEIIIFDEPTSGLDYDSMIQVSKLISKLKSYGKIIFVVTHDYEFITLTCSRIVHFDDKKQKDDFVINEENIKKLKNFFII